MDNNGTNEEDHVVTCTTEPSSANQTIEEVLQIESQRNGNQAKANGMWLRIRSRLKMLFWPIRRCEIGTRKSGDQKTCLEIFPESFRICFVAYFVAFSAFATFITLGFGNTDLDDNPVLHRFGENSICVMFDDPPFTIFGSTLWFPATFFLLAFELFDFLRVRDCYYDHYPISKRFYVYYTITSMFESFSVILFSQIFATHPKENIYMHTWPYLILQWTFFAIELKRFLFLSKMELVPRYAKIWIILCGISTLLFFCPILANLYGARLWEKYPAGVKQIVAVNGYCWGANVLLAPIVIYGGSDIGMKVDTVKVVLYLERANSKLSEK